MKTVRLERKVEIIIPSQCGCGRPLTEDRIGRNLALVKTLFSEWFGGYTITEGQGGYINEQRQECREDVLLVTSFASSEAFQTYAVELSAYGSTELESLAVHLANSLGQESVLITLDGKEAVLVFTEIEDRCVCEQEIKAAAA